MSNENKPSQISLSVHDEFKASHSLAGFETPHFHLWKIDAEFRASYPIKTDRLIDLVYLNEVMAKIKSPIEGKYLNELFSVPPTSENMADFFWKELSKELPEAPLSAVSVSLCDLEGRVSGVARLSS